MVPSQFWTPCALIVTGLVIIIIILVCSSNEPYREHLNVKKFGDFIEWDDLLHINNQWTNNESVEPLKADGTDLKNDDDPRAKVWNNGIFLDSCGNCNADGAPCSHMVGVDKAASSCYDKDYKRQDVSAHPDTNRGFHSATSTWKIQPTIGSAAKPTVESTGYTEKAPENNLEVIPPTNLNFVSYGDTVWLKNAPHDGFGTVGQWGYLEVCGSCNRGRGGCSGCNKNVWDVTTNPQDGKPGWNESGIKNERCYKVSYWKIISAIGIEEKNYVRYGEPLYLQNQCTVVNSDLNTKARGSRNTDPEYKTNGYQIYDNGGYQTRKTYLDVCGKCNSTGYGTDKCAGSHDNSCQHSDRMDVSTSYSPHQGIYENNIGGSGTWRFLPFTIDDE